MAKRTPGYEREEAPVKMTMTTQTGAFAVPARVLDDAAGYRDRGTTGLRATAFGSTPVPSASRIASAWTTVDVPTFMAVRHGGAHG
ncbi:MAG: hypothetical protein ABR500_11190 [Dermatophilaceae bacterium]|nr:hypothetical protein [Intrasporangiaceae bacterium]